MKKKLLAYLLAFFIFGLGLHGQQLIPNSGFESGWTCPESFTEDPVKELIPHWRNPNKGTPDYFHRCSDSLAGIPDNFAGMMDAHEGDAYIGLILREVFADSMPEKKASREYIYTELNDQLRYRHLYCFKLKYALAKRSRYAVDALGISFTRERLKSWDAGLLDAEPLVFNMPGNTMDNKGEWHELCGVFRARGKEQYLTIGNFVPNMKTHFYENTDSLTDTSFVYAYYYIDEITMYEIENPFECGCQDKLSAGYDWLDEDSQPFTDAYNNYLDQLRQEELLADAANTAINKQTGNRHGGNHNGNGQNQNDTAGDSDSLADNGNNSDSENTNSGGGANSGQSSEKGINQDSQHGNSENSNATQGGNSGDKDSDSNTGSNQNEGGNNTNSDSGNSENGVDQNSNQSNKDYNSLSGQKRNSRLDGTEEELIESLKDANTGFAIDLPNIYFAFNQSELLPSSYPALEKLSGILKAHPNLQIEVRGHTDNIGSNWYNKRLSNDRAEAVYQFLIESGIDESRLKYRGFGNKVPVADNETEEGRQLNRRVEIKVISNQ